MRRVRVRNVGPLAPRMQVYCGADAYGFVISCDDISATILGTTWTVCDAPFTKTLRQEDLDTEVGLLIDLDDSLTKFLLFTHLEVTIAEMVKARQWDWATMGGPWDAQTHLLRIGELRIESERSRNMVSATVEILEELHIRRRNLKNG